MSDPVKIPTVEPVAHDAFQVFFDMIDAPAALCDAGFTVLMANSSFEVLCGVHEIAGKALSSVLGGPALVVPADGRTIESEVLCKTSQRVTLTISRRGQTVAVVARGLSPAADSLEAAGRALVEQARLESQLLEVGRQVASATSEEELVASVAKGVKGLFPGRAFSVRMVDPRTMTLTSLYAEGRLRDGERDVFQLRKSMAEKTHLNLSNIRSQKLVINAGELPLLFHDTVRGIAAPLVASGQFFGAVNVEYPAGLSADFVADERVLIQLANQVAVAVRNAKLIDELTFVRKYLEELIEHANALILVVNRDNEIVVFNRSLVALTGFAKSEVLGRPVSALVPESEALKVARVMAASMSGQNQSSFEMLLNGTGGREIKATVALSTVVSQTGEVEGVMAIGQDLTKTLELERRIVQAEKLASLGQLAASVVHEINNPMTAVATYADALLKRSMLSPTADPGDVEKFRRIVDNSDRVLRFTRDLVSYARPAKEKPESVDIQQVLERAIGFCDHVLVKHGIALEKNFTPVPTFLGVRQNLIQVFVNLITNACHATPRGGRISVSTAVVNEMVVIELSDTGNGMSDEVRRRIFEPFFTTKPDGKGTGLGLSIVHGVIENHGGTIEVKSAVGQGTTFVMRLPIVRQ